MSLLQPHDVRVLDLGKGVDRVQHAFGYLRIDIDEADRLGRGLAAPQGEVGDVDAVVAEQRPYAADHLHSQDG